MPEGMVQPLTLAVDTEPSARLHLDLWAGLLATHHTPARFFGNPENLAL